MTIYFCKAPNIVVATHGDDYALADPVALYGLSTYMLVDKGGPAPKSNEMGFALYPEVTPQMHASSVKRDCARRISQHVGDNAQSNIIFHIAQLNPKETLTPEEDSDRTMAYQIWAWIGRPDGMQAKCDALIAAKDMEWYHDGKWPPWNSSWDGFVARF